MFDDVISFIKETYNHRDVIPLHEPTFIGNEKNYLNNCIDSGYVSSVGRFVQEFESKMASYLGSSFAVATVNGTSALHLSLILADTTPNDEVITQPLTFVATCNSIKYCGATPIFIDVDRNTMGLSPEALKEFIYKNTSINKNQCINNKTGRVIKACIPMHTFGHPCKIDEIKEICDENKIFLIEDAAESLGSQYKGKYTGTYSQLGIISFNGNKIITAGGGGCIITDNPDLAHKAKYLSTTAKESHSWDFIHNSLGYNYRMPNINAALLVAQLENLDKLLLKKRQLSKLYEEFFSETEYFFVKEPDESISNYWLNSILLEDKSQRDEFLKQTNARGVMTRPAWTLMNNLPMYKDAQCEKIENASWIRDRLVNIPSTAIL